MKVWLFAFLSLTLVIQMIVGVLSSKSFAQSTTGNFSLQVSPSPLVATLQPATSTTLDLKIRNTGTSTETLKIESRQFRIDEATGKVQLDDTKESEIAPWIRFSAPTFVVQPGEWYTQKITVSLPKDTGFSYSLALVISRANNTQPTESGRLIKGSVAVFMLINVDRPGAKRILEVSSFTTSENMYEYLPATIKTTFVNVGNTIVQPFGDIFIQRGKDDTTPLATLPVNDQKGYILPGSSRILSSQWSDGFPQFTITTDSTGSEKKSENWDISQVAKLRIGQYTAKLVAVYNNGTRDIPLERTTTFWVIPWKIILASIAIVLLVLLGVWTIVRKLWLFVRKKTNKGSSIK